MTGAPAPGREHARQGIHKPPDRQAFPSSVGPRIEGFALRAIVLGASLFTGKQVWSDQGRDEESPGYRKRLRQKGPESRKGCRPHVSPCLTGSRREAPCTPRCGARASRARRKPSRWLTRSKDASIASKGLYQIPPYQIGALTTPYHMRKAHRERERVLRGGIYAPWPPRRKNRGARTIALAPSGPL